MTRPAAGEPVSVEAYLRLEDGAPVRSEYVEGRLFAVVGGSDTHNLLTTSIGGLLWTATRRTPCRTFIADMKVRALEGVFYYPDVMVACEAQDDERYYRRRPCLAVEVLSPSTAAMDRGEKLRNYTRISSLQAYVLVNQDVRRVEVYRREGERWAYEILEGADVLGLSCPEVQVPLEEIYEGVPLQGGPEGLAPPRLPG